MNKRENAKNVKVNGLNQGLKLIRFDNNKGSYLWVQPEHVFFVKSADHYIKTLIQHGPEKKWLIRHCTLKDIMVLLDGDNFIRLNKFYAVNRNHLSHIDEPNKIIYLRDGFAISIQHKVPRYLINTL